MIIILSMRRTLITVHCLLLTSFLFLLSSCTPSPTPPPTTSLLLYRFNPPAFVEYSADFQPLNEIPFSIPPDCGLNNTFPAPLGLFLLIELNCPNGQTVLFLDVESGSTTQPVTDTDAHFLAWTSDGNAAYLRIDSLGKPRILRVDVKGRQAEISIPEYTYDLSVNPINDDITFTFSRGLGYGSELHLTQYEVRNTRTLYADQFNYISFARFSPDGKQIAFIKTPDSQIPFTVGELWIIPSTTDFANATQPSAQGGKFLAYADSGHGYAANWSPDGTRIAFVVRENLEDENADRLSEALISNIYIIEVETGNVIQVTHFENGYAETPHWSPDGNMLAFSGVVDGRMSVFIADVLSGEIKILETESACCPAWMRK